MSELGIGAAYEGAGGRAVGNPHAPVGGLDGPGLEVGGGIWWGLELLVWTGAGNLGLKRYKCFSGGENTPGYTGVHALA